MDQPGVDWQQHYPTYSFEHRDIVLAEYESAARILEAEERLFTNSSNVTLIVATAFGSLALGSLQTLYASLSRFISIEFVFLAITSLVCAFSLLSLKYFADRQKAILFAKRKLVVLRAMLGLNYGRLQLVLPNWRVEGATQPFAIRLFPGWGSYVAYPFWVIALFSCAILLFLVAHFIGTTVAHSLTPRISPESFGVSAALCWFLVLTYVFRASLYDTHERPSLSFARICAAVLRIELIDDIEYVLYRARLATFEMSRLGMDLTYASACLPFIEDRGFRRHSGVSLRGSLRAMRDYVTRRRLSGGSTITQQLMRSLFIVEYRKLVRRKILELLLAVWIERVLTKDDILQYYLASVRFDHGVYGWIQASQHFFGDRIQKPSKAQAFFLVERVSNIRSRVLVSRIDDLISQATASGVLDTKDADELAKLYLRFVGSGRLTVQDRASLTRLVDKWQQ